MKLPEIVPAHIMTLLVVFWVAWLYTEISEMYERNAMYSEVMYFMHKGDRFTQAEGDELEARILALESE